MLQLISVYKGKPHKHLSNTWDTILTLFIPLRSLISFVLSRTVGGKKSMSGGAVNVRTKKQQLRDTLKFFFLSWKNSVFSEECHAPFVSAIFVVWDLTGTAANWPPSVSMGTEKPFLLLLRLVILSASVLFWKSSCRLSGGLLLLLQQLLSYPQYLHLTYQTSVPIPLLLNPRDALSGITVICFPPLPSQRVSSVPTVTTNPPFNTFWRPTPTRCQLFQLWPEQFCEVSLEKEWI